MTARLQERTQIGWQVFRRTGARPHDTIAGWNISLVRYESHCATCGAWFEAFASGSAWRKRELSRRCVAHRRVGLPVDNLAPPVALRALPPWARPNTDPKKLKASLGKRRHNCAFLGQSSRLRIVHPAERDRRLAEERATARARYEAFLAERRASARLTLPERPASGPAVAPQPPAAAERSATPEISTGGPVAAAQRPANAAPHLSFLD